jgi:tetratricopeptide (TPR) repeat protein
VKLLDKARDHDGLDAAYYNLGAVAQRLRRTEDARKYYRLALENNPADDRAAAALDAISPADAAPTRYR